MENDFIYMAGFFDGEGCIRVNKRQRAKNIEYTLFISLGQNDGAIIDWVVSTFGGFIHKVKRDGSFMWIVSNRKAHEFLLKITPYLKYKKPQALIALQLNQNFRKTNPISQKELERRENIYQELKRLKQIFLPSTFAGSTTKRVNPKGMQ